jgi:tetratricopeptide (TPR) repeat protein
MVGTALPIFKNINPNPARRAPAVGQDDKNKTAQKPHADTGAGKQIAAKSNFEDPLKVTPKIQQYVDDLVGKPAKPGKPSVSEKTGKKYFTERGRAIQLMRAVIPKDSKFQVDDMVFYGLPDGLQAEYNRDGAHEARVGRGAMLPEEVMAQPEGERVAICLEYANLLVTMLRAAGIDAGVAESPDHKHANVIARLDRQLYQLDPAQLKFENVSANTQVSTHGEAIGMHYNNSASALLKQGRVDEAIEHGVVATLFYPALPLAWNNLGDAAAVQGDRAEAKINYEASIQADPRMTNDAWGRKIAMEASEPHPQMLEVLEGITPEVVDPK